MNRYNITVKPGSSQEKIIELPWSEVQTMGPFTPEIQRLQPMHLWSKPQMSQMHSLL